MIFPVALYDDSNPIMPASASGRRAGQYRWYSRLRYRSHRLFLTVLPPYDWLRSSLRANGDGVAHQAAPEKGSTMALKIKPVTEAVGAEIEVNLTTIDTAA